MFQQMADGHVASSETAAERAVEHLVAASPDLRSAALIAPDGSLIAASSSNDWSERVSELWDAASLHAIDPAQLHVATESGEVFAVRSADGSVAVAIANRFALASLMFCDLRAALRELGTDGVRAGAG